MKVLCPDCKKEANWEVSHDLDGFIAKSPVSGKWREIKEQGEIKCPACQKRMLYRLRTVVEVDVVLHPFDAEVPDASENS